MLHLLLKWLLYAVALMVVSRVIPGIRVRDYKAALLAVAGITLINMLLGPILQILAFPITLLTLGIFALVVNAFLFWLAGRMLKNFDVQGGLPAFFGSIAYSILVIIIQAIVG